MQLPYRQDDYISGISHQWPSLCLVSRYNLVMPHSLSRVLVQLINCIMTLVLKDTPKPVRSLCRSCSQKNHYPMWPWLESPFCPDRPSFLWSSVLSPCLISTPFGKKRCLLHRFLTESSPPLLITMDSTTLSVHHCETFPCGWGCGWSEGGTEKLAWVHRHHLASSCYVLHRLHVQTTKKSW